MRASRAAVAGALGAPDGAISSELKRRFNWLN